MSDQVGFIQAKQWLFNEQILYCPCRHQLRGLFFFINAQNNAAEYCSGTSQYSVFMQL